MPRSNSRRGRNNNPGGRNLYSNWGVMEMARERPLAAAAAAAGAAAAGLILWSKRSQISNQLSNISDQIGEWAHGITGEGDDTGGFTATGQTGTASKTPNQRGMSETGGGNASVGRTSGGGGSRGSASGRGRARSTAATQQ